MSDQTIMNKKPQLEITWPDGSEENFPLDGKIIRVGRDPNINELVIHPDLRTISREHFELHQELMQYRIVDIENATATYVNNESVTEYLLQNGDVITIGDETENQQVKILYVNDANKYSREEIGERSTVGSIFEGGLNSPPVETDYLDIQALNVDKVYFPLNKDSLIIGRSKNSDIKVPKSYRFISRRHAKIQKTEYGYELDNLNSGIGTQLNGTMLKDGETWQLNHGDIIRIGDENFGAPIGFQYFSTAGLNSPDGYSMANYHLAIPSDKADVLIGRSKNAGIHLQTPMVSWQHAKIEVSDGKYYLHDLNSTNGTLVNGENISSVEIYDGDQIQIAEHLFYFDDGALRQYNSQGMRVDVIDMIKDIKTRKGIRRIIDDVDMSILPREFVAIVGGSGAGKTTLINALLGINPGDGQVLINGRNFYEEYENFRDQIGYVPQSDVLHTALTVKKALEYAIQLRLPKDTTKAEMSERIETVLNTVNMNTEEIRQTRIKNLSGGQRKRISIASELIANPKLLYLDEPTSGLDPGLEKKMMYILRKMADQGRTVILITHATANIVQVDHVAFLSQGRLVFFGPPVEALEFFGVDEFADIYERIENKGEYWHDVFTRQNDRYHQRYVVKRQKNRHFLPILAGIKNVGLGVRRFFRQLSVLTRRTFNIQSADLITLALLAALYPFTAILQLLISTPDVLIGDLSIFADPILAARTMVESYTQLIDTRLFVFISGLEAVLIGMYVPSNELILERSIYLRERMVNLKVLPYLSSKILVFSIFSFIQCFLYLVVLSLNVEYPAEGVFFSGAIEIFITVFLTMISSVGIGLFISSLARSPDMAMYVLVILLFFQFFFAGIIFDLRGKSIEPLKNLTATHWSMVALGSTIDLPKIANSTILCNTLPDNPQTLALRDEFIDCHHYPDAVDDLQLSYGENQLVIAWIVLLGMGIFFYSLTAISIHRLDKF